MERVKTKGVCHNCPMSRFDYYWWNTRCLGLPDNEVMTEDKIKGMYQGYFVEGTDIPILPMWCPRMKYTYIKY